MSINEFIKLHMSVLRQAQIKYGGIYIACVVVSDGYSVELEVSQSDIAGTMSFTKLKDARECADTIEEKLIEFGISVYPNKFLWENAILRD